jgi:3-dehydroquinate synthase
VATGGGGVLHGAEFRQLAGGSVVVVLTCEPAEILRRVSDGDRPLLHPDPATSVDALMRERADRYAAAGRAIDTTGRVPEAVADEVIELSQEQRPEATLHLTVTADGDSYPVIIRSGLLDRAALEVGGRVPEARAAAVIFDAAVDGVALRLGRSLRDHGLEVLDLPVAGGEAAKRVEVVSSLWSALLRSGLGRGDLVAGVGGGAVLDSAGFVAATFARGVPFISVPTTLLAMVDAAVGGKVGIDHDDVKNAIGVIRQPRAVLIDPSVLESLPPEELRPGLAEAVKAGALASPLLLQVLGSARNSFPLEWVIEQALRIKGAYVAQDPSDHGIRRCLNLGHTFGHALESATGYRVRHGEAVAVGMVAASRLGESLGITPHGTAHRLARVLSALDLPTRAPELEPDLILGAMGHDKKRRGGTHVVVIPAEEGAALVEGVTDEAVLDALFDRVALAGGR